MRAKHVKAAVAAGAALVVTGAGTAGPALAVTGVRVPCSTSALVSAISGASSGQVFQLAAGCTYWLTSALPAVTASVTLQGTGRFTTIERSSSAPQFALLTVNGGAHLAVTGINFRNGDSAATGGAIDEISGGLTISGGTFTGNQASLPGGAVYAHDALAVNGATFTGNVSAISGGAIAMFAGGVISNSTFRGNTAVTFGGGAVFAQQYTITVNNSTFTGNSAPDTANSAQGGGFDVETSFLETGTATLSQDTFTGNTADHGGGAAAGNSTVLNVNGGYFAHNTALNDGGGLYNDGPMTVHGSVFAYNHVLPSGDGNGGGVASDDTATVTGARFDHNSATYGGGYFTDADLLTLSDSTFTGNTAAGGPDSSGGGGLISFHNSAQVTSSTFTQNSTTGVGGGIEAFASTVTLTGSTVTHNHAPAGNGGGIYQNPTAPGATVTLHSTTVANNTVNNCSPAASVPGCSG